MGSKGKKPCKTCKGTGKLTMDKFSGLFDIISDELSTFMEKSMRDVLQKYSAPLKADGEEVKVAQ